MHSRDWTAHKKIIKWWYIVRSSGNNDNSVILFGRHAGISSLLMLLRCYWRDSRPLHCSRANISAWRPKKSQHCINDATAWVGASNIAALFTLGAMSPWYNNCCWEFPWRYQLMTRSIGFGAMSLSGAIKWVQETFLAVRHYDAPRHRAYCKRHCWFLCNPFSESIAPRYRT